jgi:hypothetical protein
MCRFVRGEIFGQNRRRDKRKPAPTRPCEKNHKFNLATIFADG